MGDDVTALAAALAGVATDARHLRWADKRPWATRTHVLWQGAVPTIDLHDLNAKLAKKAVRAAAEIGGELQSGAVAFVTGRGRHSIGPGVLGKVVKGELKAICNGSTWSFRPAGPARYLLITDRDKAPAEATGGLGALFWLFVLLLLAGIAAVIFNALPHGLP